MQSGLTIRRYLITGSQRISNYWWASVIFLGGTGFLLTGFAAFLQKNIFIFNQTRPISFFPQGLIMCFYGSLGLLFGIYLWCTIIWGVGNGFNEFNKQKGTIRIFRWGLPGKDRRISLLYKIEEVEGVRVELKEGINPRRSIALQIKGKGAIPLTRIGQPVGLEDIESEASELAQFLQVSLETFYEV
uniref:photosystem I assembly protein Ycf4 n=1 Tax=Massjukichlorella minus TaxID=2650457 RepID=UPI002410FBFA|nr:photosystem I assembly protein Ycf4 [Massjukichlorella minus]WDY12968.1 photosystem I assembly protein Ycf4 [Massjukichlorella minus]